MQPRILGQALGLRRKLAREERRKKLSEDVKDFTQGIQRKVSARSVPILEELRTYKEELVREARREIPLWRSQ